MEDACSDTLMKDVTINLEENEVCFQQNHAKWFESLKGGQPVTLYQTCSSLQLKVCVRYGKCTSGEEDTTKKFLQVVMYKNK